MAKKPPEPLIPLEELKEFVAANGYTSLESRRVGEALLACNDADRAYLLRWILRWIDDYGRISQEAEKLPENGC